LGLQLINLAKFYGLNIIATASKQKHDLLRNLGVNEIYNSRDPSFYGEIENKYPKGIDIVVNSLNGDHIRRCIDITKLDGSYIDVGKIGVFSQEEVLKIKPVKYLNFDLGLLNDKAAILREAIDFYVKNRLYKQSVKPTIYKWEDLKDAYIPLSSGKSVGKILVKGSTNNSHKNLYNFAKNEEILITGGNGALGLFFTKKLIDSGVSKIILTGRSPLSEEVNELIIYANKSNQRVLYHQCDLTNENSVKELMQMERGITGIIHAAGVLDDRMLKNITKEQIDKVHAPKIEITKNLLKFIPGKLNFWVNFTSVAGILGSPGQGVYASCNTYLDILCYKYDFMHNIAWGPWDDIGMAAKLDDNIKKRKQKRGVMYLKPERGWEILNDCLIFRPKLLIGCAIDFNKISTNYESVPKMFKYYK